MLLKISKYVSVGVKLLNKLFIPEDFRSVIVLGLSTVPPSLQSPAEIELSLNSDKIYQQHSLYAEVKY